MAKVMGCGHVEHVGMVSVLSVEDSPQVHVHLLTQTLEEHKEMGHGSFELCCHGCGASLLVLHNTIDGGRDMRIKSNFCHQHEKCPNFGFELWCPNFRTPSKAKILDLREGCETEEERFVSC